MAIADQDYGVRHTPPNLERVARLSVMSDDTSRAQTDRAQLSDGQAVAEQYLAIDAGQYPAIEDLGPISEDPPWRNSKERRKESRANLPGNLARQQQHHAEPPPSWNPGQ